MVPAVVEGHGQGPIVKDDYEYEGWAEVLLGNPIDCWRNREVFLLKKAPYEAEERSRRIASVYRRYDRNGYDRSCAAYRP